MSYFVKVRSIENPLGEYRTIGQDPATGYWIVYKGDFVVFDSDQRNGSGDKCRWISDPEWFIDGAQAVIRPREAGRAGGQSPSGPAAHQQQLRSSGPGIGDEARLSAGQADRVAGTQAFEGTPELEANVTP